MYPSVNVYSSASSETEVRSEYDHSSEDDKPLGNTPVRRGRRHRRQPGGSKTTRVVAQRNKLSLRNAVVKIFCTTRKPMWYYPFQNGYQSDSTSSGFVIESGGKRFLMCNAHGIAHATSIRVMKNGDDTKHSAKVEHVTHEGDLALLSVANESFWGDVTPLRFCDVLPELQSEVIVLGYPTGGYSLSITKGVVSRIEVQGYTHSGAHLPCIQTDAAINGGNSGGPALLKNKVIGVAFQGYTSSQNIGYIIPCCVIKFFLSSIEEHGEFCGFGQIGLTVQTIENESFRKYLKVGKRTGLIVHSTNPLADSREKLKKDDLIMSVDNHRIGNDATVELRQGERVSWRWVSSMKKPGSYLTMRICRDGEEMDVDVQVYPDKKNDELVPNHLHDEKPTYFVHGGLVLTQLSWPLLTATYGSSWSKAPPSMMERANKAFRDKEDEQVVVMTQILDNPINVNYTMASTLDLVKKINGEEVLNVADALDKILHTEADYFRIEFENMGSVVLNRMQAVGVNHDVKEEHRMFRLRSADLDSDFSEQIEALERTPEAQSFSKAAQVELWSFFVNNFNSGQEVQGWDGSSKRNRNGIKKGSVYNVVRFEEIPEYNLRLVQFEYPENCKEWRGDWANLSRKWQQYPGVKTALGMNHGDGTFWMTAEDFFRAWTSLSVKDGHKMRRGKFNSAALRPRWKQPSGPHRPALLGAGKQDGSSRFDKVYHAGSGSSSSSSSASSSASESESDSESDSSEAGGLFSCC